jgi:uncharacterized protein YegP (UPF0339 family)
VRFKIKQSHDNQWFFVIEAAGNYETLATSEMYESRGACEHAIDVIRQQAGSATVTEETASGAR